MAADHVGVTRPFPLQWRRHGKHTTSRARTRITGLRENNHHLLPNRFRGYLHRRRRLIMVLAVPAILLLACGVFALACWIHIDRVSVNFPGSAPGGTTYLLVGSDSRTFVQSAADRATFGVPADSEGQHADVILLLRIENGGHEEVLPVPRDLFTLLPDGAPTRITMSLQSGPQTVVDTLCDSLGVGVNHLVLIHMNGLRSLVDDVGGITVHAATPERDTVTGLSIAHAGSAHLDGVQALAYARSRHLEYLEHGVWLPASTASDERSGRDAQVLSLLGARLHISPTAPLASARTLWELSGAVTVDGGTSPMALAQLAGALGHMQTAAHLVLPVTFNPGYVPVDDLAPGGPEVLARFNGGRTPHCSIRTGLNPTAPSGGTT